MDPNAWRVVGGADELDAGRFERGANGCKIRACYGQQTVFGFGAIDCACAHRRLRSEISD